MRIVFGETRYNTTEWSSSIPALSACRRISAIERPTATRRPPPPANPSAKGLCRRPAGMDFRPAVIRAGEAAGADAGARHHRRAAMPAEGETRMQLARLRAHHQNRDAGVAGDQIRAGYGEIFA